MKREYKVKRFEKYIDKVIFFRYLSLNFDEIVFRIPTMIVYRHIVEFNFSTSITVVTYMIHTLQHSDIKLIHLFLKFLNVLYYIIFKYFIFFVLVISILRRYKLLIFK